MTFAYVYKRSEPLLCEFLVSVCSVQDIFFSEYFLKMPQKDNLC